MNSESIDFIIEGFLEPQPKIDIPKGTSSRIIREWKLSEPGSTFRLGDQCVIMTTAYFSIDRTIRGNEFYFERGLQLFKLTPNVKWNFFTNEYDFFSKQDLPNVNVIKTEIEDLFPAQDLIPSDGLIPPTGGDPKKDTVDYLRIQNSKLAIMLKSPSGSPSESLPPSGSDKICWCDFGVIGYIEDKKRFAAQLTRISRLDNFEGFYSPSFYSDIKPYNIHDKPVWVFAGGFLIGDRSSIETFNEKFVKEVRNTVRFGRLTWEVNLWYLVYSMYPKLVKLYKCYNHNIDLVERFLYDACPV